MTGDTIKRRSPIEQAIAEKKDRRARYVRLMREQGYHQTTIWVRRDKLEAAKTAVHILNDPDSQLHAELFFLLGKGMGK